MRNLRNILSLLEKEDTAEDLQRKIASLDAMLNDKSTTPGEKTNAQTLKATLEKRLKTEFPDNTPNQPEYNSEDKGYYSSEQKTYKGRGYKKYPKYDEVQDKIDDLMFGRGINANNRSVARSLVDAWQELIEEGNSNPDRDALVSAIINTVHVISPSIADLMKAYNYQTDEGEWA